jgi:hypothetical protein
MSFGTASATISRGFGGRVMFRERQP